MPFVAVNLSEKIIGPIRELVERGHYHSLESFLEVAAFNQLALERSVSPQELIARGHRVVHDITRPTEDKSDDREIAAGEENGVPRSRRRRKKAKSRQGGKASAQRISPPPPEVDVEATLARWVIPAKSGAFPAVGTAERCPADEHLWGQVNRLFPIKLVCRWAAKAAAGAEWPSYEAVGDGLPDDAAAVGTVLERWDADAGRKRDEVLSTGLPRRGNSASRDRFLSQYLARVTRNGEVHMGAVCHYALAGCGENKVVLTDRGLEFARLVNPILDGRDAASTATLSENEAGFLRRQIMDYAPGEHRDMRAVLGAVAAGKVTPTDLAGAVRGQFPDDWTDIVFRTHVSGLIARLADLRLMRRRWEGRNVQYDVGDAQQVKSFLG